MPAGTAPATKAEMTAQQYMQYIFPQNAEGVYSFWQEFSQANPRTCPNGNFLKGVKWSPDGACLLVANDDNWLRVFDLPHDTMDISGQGPVCPSTGSAAADSYPVALRVQEGETVYDYAWYPNMTVTDAASCCFASTIRGHPIHLWDAMSGQLRAVYKGYNDADEPTAALSLAFTPNGSRIYAGYNRSIRIFDVSRPGRDCRRINTHIKRGSGLPGIVSAIAFSPDEGRPAFALGSYGGVVGIFDGHTDELQYLLHGHKGGVTQVQFSRDGNYLYSGARQDPHLLCWDVRYTSGEVYRLERDTAATNQRIMFDIEPCGRHLASGGCSGTVRVFDLQTGAMVDEMAVAADAVNGCAFHPVLPLLAVATGERQYPLAPPDDDEGGSGDEAPHRAAPAASTPCVLQGPPLHPDNQQTSSSDRINEEPSCNAQQPDIAGHPASTCSAGTLQMEGSGAAPGACLTNVLRVLRLSYQWASDADPGVSGLEGGGHGAAADAAAAAAGDGVAMVQEAVECGA